MKKLLIVLVALFSFNMGVIEPVSASESIMDARKTIGEQLKDAVTGLRSLFLVNDGDISNSNDDITDINLTVESIKNASEEPEINITVLKHGDTNMPTCRSILTSYTNEFTCTSENDLKWTGTKWTWDKPAALSDCSPALGEVKISDGKGGFVCVQEGVYKNIPDGYGACNNSIGRKYSKSKCMFTNSATNKTYQVSDSKCGSAISSTSAICGYGWVFVGYGSCQSNNYQYAQYQCKSRTTGAVVSGSNCYGSSPSSSRICSGSWVTGAWSSCSGGTCGSEGSQSRSVSCSGASSCNPSSKPSTSQSCSMAACLGSWLTTSWSSCAGGVCGGSGTQTRSVTCSNNNCSGAQPSTSQSCTMAPCGLWQVGSWSSCSGFCGTTSTQTRSVSCPSGNCSSGTKPSTSQSCTNSPCGGVWMIGTWGLCSKTCGSGIQTRLVTCTTSSCTTAKPATSQSCNTQSCSGTWQTGSWSSCTKTCGGGTQTRSVTCSTSSCTGTQPANSQSCNTQSCNGVWRMDMGGEVGNSGGCSVGGTCNPIGSTKVCCGSWGIPNGYGGCRPNGGGSAVIDPIGMECVAP